MQSDISLKSIYDAISTVQISMAIKMFAQWYKKNANTNTHIRLYKRHFNNVLTQQTEASVKQQSHYDTRYGILLSVCHQNGTISEQ